MSELTPDEVVKLLSMTDAQRDRYMVVILAAQRFRDEDGRLDFRDAGRDMWFLGQMAINIFDETGAPREWGSLMKNPA